MSLVHSGVPCVCNSWALKVRLFANYTLNQFEGVEGVRFCVLLCEIERDYFSSNCDGQISCELLGKVEGLENTESV